MATKTRPRTNERPSAPRQPGPRQSGPRQANPVAAKLAVLQRVAKDSISEMKKITWPDKDATRNLTIVVIAISLILGLLLGGVDAAFVRLWQAMP
jgi:preprotein translocase subunit SecE